MINSDVLESVTLSTAAIRSASATGPARVDFRLRDGSRERKHATIAVSGTSASAVAEGPIGGDPRRFLAGLGAPELSRSHRSIACRQIRSHFGFADAQGRARLRPDAASAGRSDGHRRALAARGAGDEIDSDDLYLGDNAPRSPWAAGG